MVVDRRAPGRRATGVVLALSAIGESVRCGVIVIINRPTASSPTVPVVKREESGAARRRLGADEGAFFRREFRRVPPGPFVRGKGSSLHR